MESKNDQAAGWLDATVNQLGALVDYVPTVLTVILILAVGWIVAHLARRVVRRIGSASNHWLVRMFPSGVLSGARLSSLAVTLIGEIVFWAAILISVTMAARFAELGSVTQWLDRITYQLPNLLAGVAIVVVGYFLGVFAGQQLQEQAGTDTSSVAPLVGRFAQPAIFLIALIVALDQVGIDVTLLIGLAVVVTAGVFTALAIAFASGARVHISNLIGVRTAHQSLAVGMTIQVGDVQGEIVEFSPTLIALDTEKGRVLVPGRHMDESIIAVMGPVEKGADEND